MKSEAAWYWIASGVFALGLTSHLANGGARRLQQTVECSVQGVQGVSDRIAARFESVALALAENPTSDDQVDAATEDSQQSVGCERLKLVHIQTSLAKLENLPPQVIRIERIKIRLPKQFNLVRPPNPTVVVERDTI